MSRLLNIESEFQNFLESIGLEDIKKGSVGYEDLSKIYASGMMQMFSLLAVQLPELDLSDDEYSDELVAIFNEIKNF